MDELKTKKSDKTCWPSNLQLACKSRKYIDESRVYIYSLSVLENAQILIFSDHWQVENIGELENIGEIMFSDGVHLNFDGMKKCVRQPRGCLLSQSFWLSI